MAVVMEVQDTGSADVAADVAAMIEHVLADHPGEWRVVIIGSQDSDLWEMKILGPNQFERNYTLEGSAGEHDPRVIGGIVSRMVPGRSDFSGLDIRRDMGWWVANSACKFEA